MALRMTQYKVCGLRPNVDPKQEKRDREGRKAENKKKALAFSEYRARAARKAQFDKGTST